MAMKLDHHLRNTLHKDRDDRFYSFVKSLRLHPEPLADFLNIAFQFLRRLCPIDPSHKIKAFKHENPVSSSIANLKANSKLHG